MYLLDETECVNREQDWKTKAKRGLKGILAHHAARQNAWCTELESVYIEYVHNVRVNAK